VNLAAPCSRSSDLKALNVVTATKSSVYSDVHVSASAQRALQHNWVGGIGHFLLVIAERKHRTVHVAFLNSLPEYEPNEYRIRKAARNIVRHSGWMGNQWSIFEGENWPVLPSQLGNTCGIHVVLNA